MPRSNEELAAALQRGDRDASAELLAQNQGLLTRWAGAIQARYGLSNLLDDLVQEGTSPYCKRPPDLTQGGM